MAVRDRNLFAWQVYVMTMAFISVGLLLGMFFLWRSWSDKVKTLEATQADLTTARSEVATNESRVDRLLSMLGYGANTQEDMDRLAQQFANDEKLAQAEKDFADQMKLFSTSVGPAERNLINLPTYLMNTIRDRNTEIDQARAREKQLQDSLSETQQRETEARTNEENLRKKAESDLAATRQSHSDALAKVNKEKDDILKNYETYKQKLDGELAAEKANVSRLTAENSDLQDTVNQQSEIILQINTPDFAASQGKIVNVDGDKAWVDLGSDDKLREGVVFSVIDALEVNISNAKPKAQLTIVRVVGPRLAQAKIVDPNVRMPVTRGDLVYSPAWRAGSAAGFALVGLMDINGDRRDDLERVKELIKNSGGRLDAVMDYKGRRDDQLEGVNANTRYVVVGTDVGSTTVDTPANQNRDREYANFLKDAQRYGVQQISLDKLLGYLKTPNSDRTVTLGSSMNPEEFRNLPKNPPVSNGTVSEIFMKRRFGE
ncbi:MAG: hypothetical protein KDB03_20030 [Planctomycetales bacterium]|nr:hypothetical protein [Planctomycetales bacterium]